MYECSKRYKRDSSSRSMTGGVILSQRNPPPLPRHCVFCTVFHLFMNGIVRFRYSSCFLIRHTPRLRPSHRSPSTLCLSPSAAARYPISPVSHQLRLSTAVGRVDFLSMAGCKDFQRLPRNVIPSFYNISLKLDLEGSTFEGSEKIDIQVAESTKTIVLNSLDLAIKNVSLATNDGQVIAPSAKLCKEDETLTLNFDSDLHVGKASLTLEFSGVLNDSLKGLYRSKTSVSDGKPKYAAVTQFAPTDARRCFPCWDEPTIKAVFKMNLTVPKDAVALSNMPVESENVEGDWKKCSFQDSPIMSSYLVAIAVGDYEYVEDKSEDGVLVRVYTPPGAKEQGRFALYVGTKVLPFYKDYFKIAYPLPKLDMIAVADLAYGAMENWGLVTYRQARILVDSNNSSSLIKQIVASIVGHELAHQWFGNIVTMEWWTHLWLNEGFASFIQDLCVDHLFPEYNIWTQFVSDTLITALELDCLQNSHPIEVPVNHPDEINEIFDAISYSKGASILRMLHNYIGDEAFRGGLNLYLTRHKYKNTFTEDLWVALEEVSKKPVRAVMSTWTLQLGFPVITVTASEQVGSSRVLTVTQEKFVADAASQADDTEWLVPLSFSTQGREKEIAHTEVLSKKTGKITIPNVDAKAWVKVNPGTTGVFRVMYPPKLLEQMFPGIVDKSLPPLDRVGLLDDLLALVRSGRADVSQLLKIISLMRDEDDFTVWKVIANSLDKLGVISSYSDFGEELKKFGRYVFKPILGKVGWESKPSERHPDTLLRSLVIGKLGLFGDQETQEEAKRRFQNHLSKTHLIPADLRSPIYRTVVSCGDEKTYDTFIKLYREEKLQEEKDRILTELGYFKNPALLNKLLDFAMTDEVRPQDKVFVMISVARTKQGRELVWDFVKTRWTDILKMYEGGFILPRLVKSSLENFASPSRAAELEEFFKKVNWHARSIEQAAESIRLNASWLARDNERVKNFLNGFQYD